MRGEPNADSVAIAVSMPMAGSCKGEPLDVPEEPRGVHRGNSEPGAVVIAPAMRDSITSKYSDSASSESLKTRPGLPRR